MSVLAGLAAVLAFDCVFRGVGVKVRPLIDICGVAVGIDFFGVLWNSFFFNGERWNAAGVGLLMRFRCLFG